MNRWKGKYTITNFKREGFKAVNHPKVSRKVYLVGGKAKGKFASKIYEMDLKNGKATPSEISEMPIAYGD